MRAGFPLGAITLALVLAGCSQDPSAPDNPESAAPTAKSTQSSTAPAVVEAFSMPTLCSQILPTERLTSFAGENLILLGGPGGKYGDEYLLDPTPEQQLGGITCIWGLDDSEISTVSISVAPLGAASRSNVVTDLAINQGLNESIVDSTTAYWQHGDTDHEPALLNVLRADSWISIIMTLGGPDSFDAAEDIAA